MSFTGHTATSPSHRIFTEALVGFEPITKLETVLRSNRSQQLPLAKELNHVLHHSVVVQLRSVLYIRSTLNIEIEEFPECGRKSRLYQPKAAEAVVNRLAQLRKP